eukprot:2471468-Pleurochrysis_carterae.AAC.1
MSRPPSARLSRLGCPCACARSGISRKMPPAMAQSVRAFGRKLSPLVGPANVSYTQGARCPLTLHASLHSPCTP